MTVQDKKRIYSPLTNERVQSHVTRVLSWMIEAHDSSDPTGPLSDTLPIAADWATVCEIAEIEPEYRAAFSAEFSTELAEYEARQEP